MSLATRHANFKLASPCLLRSLFDDDDNHKVAKCSNNGASFDVATYGYDCKILINFAKDERLLRVVICRENESIAHLTSIDKLFYDKFIFPSSYYKNAAS